MKNKTIKFFGYRRSRKKVRYYTIWKIPDYSRSFEKIIENQNVKVDNKVISHHQKL